MAPEAVGVLGGTFDPVHRGHLALAQRVRQSTGLERVLFLPAACPPHKQGVRLAPAEHRAAMVRLAIEGRQGFELCDRELRSGGVCFTIDTLRGIRAEGLVTPVFLLGADALRELPTWKGHAALIHEFDLVVVDRETAGESWGDPAIAAALRELPAGAAGREMWQRSGAGRGGRIFLLRVPWMPVSSRDVRAHIAAGRSLSGLVPDAVARYIEVNRLYRQEGDR